MSFSGTFSQPFNHRPAPMPATLQATGHLAFEFTARGVGTVTVEDATDVNIFDGTITKVVALTPLDDSGSFLAKVDDRYVGIGDDIDGTDLMPTD